MSGPQAVRCPFCLVVCASGHHNRCGLWFLHAQVSGEPWPATQVVTQVPACPCLLSLPSLLGLSSLEEVLCLCPSGPPHSSLLTLLLVLGWGRSTVRAMWGASATVWVLARVAGVGAPLPLLPCLPVLLRQVMLREQNSDGVRGSPMAPLWGGDAVMEGSRVLGKAHPQIHEFHHDGTAAECLCSVSPH